MTTNRDPRWGAASNTSDGEDSSLHDELGRVWPLLGRHLAFHRRLVDVTECVKAALLLSQSIYWMGHGRDIEARGGWFDKTAVQWTQETGLSLKEQQGARRRLRDVGVLSEGRHGQPARLHFRVELDRLTRRVAGSGIAHVLDWHDVPALYRLLGPAQAYYAVLAGVTGGVIPALMLSRGLVLTRNRERRTPAGWFVRTAAQWRDELGLTRREQEVARRDLRHLGLWEERVVGMPPSLRTRVCIVRLHGLLATAPRVGTKRSDVRAAQPPECEIPTGWNAQDVETRLRQSHILGAPEPPSLMHQNRHDELPKTAITNIRTTSLLLQPPPASDHEHAECVPVRGGGELIFPQGLEPDELIAAKQLVDRCPAHAQSLLDEWAARLQAGKVSANRIGYLRALVGRALSGEFVPETGLRLARERREQRTSSRQRDTETDAGVRVDAKPIDPASRTITDAHRAALWAALGAEPPTTRKS